MLTESRVRRAVAGQCGVGGRGLVSGPDLTPERPLTVSRIHVSMRWVFCMLNIFMAIILLAVSAAVVVYLGTWFYRRAWLWACARGRARAR
jgi:hypothetical protein